MKYRSEIDGLRAVAVVPVILFHAGFETFGGGFVGVDVFFVISGYLITTIIIDEMTKENFSLLRFYERRARRILPALVFVVLCCILAAWFLLLPSDMKDFSRSLVAVATFSSNILFWRESGYFEAAAELKPLLHTWSLAVEEQFYILFPLFLMAVWRFGARAVVWMLVAAFVISLAAAHWGAYNKPRATFFLLPTRAWELLMGSLAAIYLQKRAIGTPHWMSNALSAAGLAAILYSVVAFDEATPFPSLYALAPTLGTVLIILFAVRGTAVHSVLSLRGCVGVGLMSYSLYLWHQPVFAFWRHHSLFEPTHAQMLLLSLACVPLACITYMYVETPFRARSEWFRQGRVFATTIISLLLLSAVGIWGYGSNGFAERYPNYAYWASYDQERHPDGRCISGFSTTELEPCSLGSSDGSGKVLAIGDSHMHQWVDVFEEIAVENGVSLEMITKSACAIADVSYFYQTLRREYTECSEWRRRLVDYINEVRPSRLVIQNSSMGYMNATLGLEEWREGLHAFFEAIDESIAVTWILDNPRFPHGVKACIDRAILTNDVVETCAIPRTSAIASDIQRVELSVLQDVRADVVDLTERFCDAERCFGLIEGVPVMADTNHISQAFIRSLKGDIEPALTLEQ